MTPDTNKERADFEAWIRTQPGYTYAVLGRRDSPGSARVGEYVSQSVEFSWRAWQARAAKAPAAPTQAEPMFWVRPLRNGMYEGPVHHKSVGGKMMREEKPDEWHPLYTAPPAPTEQWVSVAERLPNPHQEVLLVIDGGHVTTGSYMPNLHCFCWEPCDDEREDSAVTHWMTKPAPPQGAAKGTT